MKNNKTKAILLAAGVGRRMIPIHQMVPKALLEVRGQPLIERIIQQLHDKGVYDIYVVVGYMKEKLDYLASTYHVHLCNNPHYFDRGALYSLYLSRHQLEDCFIVPCDLYFEENPFHTTEKHSWTLMTKGKTNPMKYTGLTYVSAVDGKRMKQTLEMMDVTHDTYLELISKMDLCERYMTRDDVYEINTYEDLRAFDGASIHLKNRILNLVADILDVDVSSIQHIRYLKKGMTNHSFLFDVRGERYIMRIPGKGTEALINRKQEKDAYEAIKGLGISDDVVYFNAENGFKLTKYLPDARTCEATRVEDLHEAMNLLRKFHHSGVKVDHWFDLFKQIQHYESLWGNHSSLYPDYPSTKQKILALKDVVDTLPKHEGLTHLDAIADNFLFYDGGVRLIDWEYASMQDTDVDLAMFCIYSMYEPWEVERLIDIYYVNACPDKIRLKVYCYIAICGLLWSNWCEYKYTLGVTFGTYALKQYQYAKEYYEKAMHYLKEC